MGVNLKSIISFRQTELESLKGKRIAVDAYNTIYQFLSIVRQYDGTPLKDSKGNITSHLSGLFYRNINLMKEGLQLCYVFDGMPPSFKTSTLEKRKERKIKAREEYKQAIKEGDIEKAFSKASQTARMDEKMKEESKLLLKAMGIPVVQAPSEGEAQSAKLVVDGLCYATASQDYDSFLFGTPILIRNLNISGKKKVLNKNYYKEVKPEKAELKEILKELELSRDELILVAMLCGTDFNNGVSGVGPKNGLKKVKQLKTLDNLKKELNWNEDFLDEVFNFFKNPPVIDVKELKWEKLDEEKIKKILVDKHEFSEERIDSSLKKITEMKEQKTQKSLFNF